jgi:hyperosmotically inducible protein
MDINVDTYDGVVTLFGMVPNQEAKAAAEADAHKVNGVRRVANELQVVPKPEQKTVQAKDDDVKADVKRALDEKGIKGVDVDVKNGVVRLTGNQESAQDSLSAGFCARSVPGVRSVQNEIHLKNDEHKNY